MPLLFALVMGFSSPVVAIEPPAELCSVLLARGVPVSEARIREYFEPHLGVAYRDLDPELRRKLAHSVVASMTYKTEGGQFRLSGGLAGNAIAHLWLLGYSRAEIVGIVRPFFENYWQEEIAPAVWLLVPPGIPSETEDLVSSIQAPSIPRELDSTDAEQSVFEISEYFHAAMLAGDRESALRFLRYMILLVKTDPDPELVGGWDAAELVNALEVFGAQEELLALGEFLVSQDRLEGAVYALARVADPRWKPLANKALVRLANSLGTLSDLEGMHLLLSAWVATGAIEKRYFDSHQNVRLVKKLSPKDKLAAKKIHEISKQIFAVTNVNHEPLYVRPVIEALSAAGNNKALKEWGLVCMAVGRRSGHGNYANAFINAFEFYFAAGKTRLAREAWDGAWEEIQRYPFPEMVPPLIEDLASMAFRSDHRAGMKNLVEKLTAQNRREMLLLVSQYGMGDTSRGEAFMSCPEIPKYLTDVLSEEARSLVDLWSSRPTQGNQAVAVIESVRQGDEYLQMSESFAPPTHFNSGFLAFDCYYRAAINRALLTTP